MTLRQIKIVGDVISIHALARRATRISQGIGYIKMDFNPRSRTESDAQSNFDNRQFAKISIHALARRATAIGA